MGEADRPVPRAKPRYVKRQSIQTRWLETNVPDELVDRISFLGHEITWMYDRPDLALRLTAHVTAMLQRERALTDKILAEAGIATADDDDGED